MNAHASPMPQRFLALGDSYTLGEGVAADECWPAQLRRRLAAHGIGLDEPQIIAQTGWSSDELLAAIDVALAAKQFSAPCALVSLQIGVNDQYRGSSVASYCNAFSRLLEHAVAFAGQRADRVMVVSIPDWGSTAFARDKGCAAAAVGIDIDAFNAAARAIATAQRVAFVDVTSLSREIAHQPAMLGADRLHPSAAQYALWADEILGAAASALSGGADPA